jgi:hypothetical protein
MGEFGIGLKEFIYLHYLVRIFNEAEDSPLFGRIKMLGRTDPSAGKKQTVSQSFLVEQLYAWTLQEIKRVNRKLELKRIPVLAYYINNNFEHIATKVLSRYFLAIEQYYNQFYGTDSWDNDKNPFLKTIGIGAIIEILPSIVISIIIDKCIVDEQKRLDEIKIKDFEKYFLSIFNEEFNAKKILIERFSKGSSQGLVKVFASELWQRVIIVSQDYEIKENKYLDWYETQRNITN